ncbi:PH domain-containing protein [soil metagenome]
MTEAPQSEARRLHALTLVLRGVGIVPGLVLLALPLIRGVDETPALFMALAYFAILWVVVGLPFAIAHFVRFRYWITPREIVIQSGVLNRQNRSIPIERIQNVEIRQSLLPRMFGLARVQIETAGSQAAEGLLEFVSLKEANAIRTVVREHQRRAPALVESAPTAASGGDVADIALEGVGRPDVDPSRLLVELPFHRVLLSGAYRFSLLYILLIFSGIQYLNVEPEEIIGWFTGGLFEPLTAAIAASPWVAVLTGIALAVLFSWLAGILVNLNRFHRFVLSREGDKLHRRHGLLTVMEGTIPLRKVQAAVFRANALMRRGGWQMLKLQTMGMDADQHGNQVAVPFARQSEILSVTPEILPFEMPAAFLPVSKVQIRRLSIRYTAYLAVLVAAAWWFITPDALWALAGWPLLPLIAYVQYRNHGYAFNGRHLFVRHGVLIHHVWVLPVEKLQALFANATFFQRRLRLSNILVDTAGATAYPAPIIRDLAEGDATTLLDQLHAAAQLRAGVPEPAALPF